MEKGSCLALPATGRAVALAAVPHQEGAEAVLLFFDGHHHFIFSGGGHADFALTNLFEIQSLAEGIAADAVLFDPSAIQDHAAFDNPHQYATRMVHVFVNGTQVLRDGEHTDAKPGRVVRGPGWKGWKLGDARRA
jgi:hypothetical protein